MPPQEPSASSPLLPVHEIRIVRVSSDVTGGDIDIPSDIGKMIVLPGTLLNGAFVPKASFVGLLDGVPAPNLAISLRRLLTSYTSSAAATFHRTSDSTNKIIGFTATGDFDTATYNTFCGAGNANGCSISTWFDQSGNGNNVSNATVSQQPFVSLNAMNGHAVTLWSSIANSNLVFTLASPISSPWTINAVSQGNGTEQFIIGSSGGSNGIAFDHAVNQVSLFQGSGFLDATASDASAHFVMALGNGASSSVIVDGTTTSGASGGAATLSSSLNVGCLTPGSFQFGGPIAELVVWAGNQTASAATLRTNQKSYYGTP